MRPFKGAKKDEGKEKERERNVGKQIQSMEFLTLNTLKGKKGKNGVKKKE